MAQGTPVTYQVTGVTPSTTFNGTSTPVPGKLVAYTTSSGYTGSVFVPDSVFADKAAITRMIEGEVRLVVAAQNITGSIAG